MHGGWKYLYRAIDRDGALVDAMLNEHRNLGSGQALFSISEGGHRRDPRPGHGGRPRRLSPSDADGARQPRAASDKLVAAGDIAVRLSRICWSDSAHAVRRPVRHCPHLRNVSHWRGLEPGLRAGDARRGRCAERRPRRGEVRRRCGEVGRRKGCRMVRWGKCRMGRRGGNHARRTTVARLSRRRGAGIARVIRRRQVVWNKRPAQSGTCHAVCINAGMHRGGTGLTQRWQAVRMRCQPGPSRLGETPASPRRVQPKQRADL